MIIEQLLAGVKNTQLTNAVRGLDVTALVLDSRKISAGDVFVALRGAVHNGEDYITLAIESGAVCALHDDAFDASNLPSAIAKRCVAITHLKHQLGVIASRLHNNPSQTLKMIGVTGTDGKTSTSHFIAQLLNLCGERKVAVVGTVGNGVLSDLSVATHTTPDAISLQALLADFKHQNVHTVAMEVSSHALEQGRVSGVNFDVAVLTNLARDHMDYHHSMKAYAKAKARLFNVESLSSVVINGDDDFGCNLIYQLPKNIAVYVYGFDEDLPQTGVQMGGKLKASQLICNQDGLTFEVSFNGQKACVRCGLMGAFNAHNILASMCVALSLGLAFDDVVKAVSELKSVKGRMQRISFDENKPTVIVDYAHTPQALDAVLSAICQHVPTPNTKLFCVFGCGGDRDTGKRSLMGDIAYRYSDVIVLTDDNPRTESPSAIFDDVLSGMPSNSENKIIKKIHNRDEAIEYAIANATEHDIVLIAGKGHEDYQVVGEEKLWFCDATVAQRVLSQYAPLHAGGLPC